MDASIRELHAAKRLFSSHRSCKNGVSVPSEIPTTRSPRPLFLRFSALRHRKRQAGALQRNDYLGFFAAHSRAHRTSPFSAKLGRILGGQRGPPALGRQHPEKILPPRNANLRTSEDRFSLSRQIVVHRCPSHGTNPPKRVAYPTRTALFSLPHSRTPWPSRFCVAGARDEFALKSRPPCSEADASK